MLQNSFPAGSKFSGVARGDVVSDGATDKAEFRSRMIFRLTLVVAAVLIWLIILVNLLPG
jgi:hypothetical protein